MKYTVKFLDGSANFAKVIETGTVNKFEHKAIEAFTHVRGKYKGYQIVSISMFHDSVDIYVRKEIR